MRAHSLLIVRSANHVFIATKSKVMCKYGRCVVALKLVVLVVSTWDVMFHVMHLTPYLQLCDMFSYMQV